MSRITTNQSAAISKNPPVRKPLVVEIRVFADLRKTIDTKFTLNPAESFAVELAPGTTIKCLMEMLSISTPESIIPLINGLRQPHDFILQDGDRVGLFPPVGGG